ncbi:MAG: DUF4838 domain-containing protein [Verrucomicrobiota bacterium]
MTRAFLLLLAASLQAAPLFDGGRWYGPVVLPAAPADDEWRAARTLQDFCEKVTGARPELVTEGQGAAPTVGLFVGRTAAFAATGVVVPDPEGDLLMTAVRDDRVFLLGDSPAATRMTVGRFAERTLGVTFLFPGPDGTDWRPLARVLQPEGEVFRPAFAWRSVSGLTTEDAEDWAFSVGYGRGLSFSHGMFRAFGPREWKEDPTLFVEVDGVRVRPTGSGYDPNPNLSHPKAAELGARFTRDWFHRNPDAFCAPLGVNDTTEYGDDAPSSGWYRDRPMRTDHVIGFLNSVADSFWDPSGDLTGERRAIGTLAYFHTLAAPTIPVRPAVFPWVCLYRMGHADPAFAREDEANLSAWVRSGARRVGAYDYWFGADYASPHVDFSAQVSAIRAAHRAGVKGWIAELYPLWSFDAPKAWLGSRLLADPAVDPQAALDRWFDAAYGSAGARVRDAYAVTERAWAAASRIGGGRGLARYLKESSARVLTDADAAAVSARVSEARALLVGVSPREAAQRRRLERFAEAWELALAFRRVIAARDAGPATAPRAVRALNALTDAEDAFVAAEKRFNLRQSFHGSPVRWSALLHADPRAAWIRLAASEPGPRADLPAWAARESRLGALVAYSVILSGAPGETVHRIDLGSVEDRRGLLRIDEHRLNAVRWHEGRLSVRAPSGTLSPRRAFPVVPGTPLVLSAELAASDDPLAEARLIVRFPGSRRRPQDSALVGPAGGELATVVPPDATTVEYELAFERSVEVLGLRLSAFPAEVLR